VVPQEGRDQLEPLPASTAPYELRRRTGCGNWAEILLGSGVLVAGAEECASRCTQRGDCRAFNYQSGGVALHCHAAKEASKAGKGWCYLFAEGCQTGADKCNDLYVPRTAGVNFTLARQGTGCANWERIGMGETTVAGSARQCAGWCSASAGCRGFNWQPSACSDGEQVQRGACILFRSLCAVEENACWDMYEVNGLSLLELTDALRPGSFADPEEALAQFPITVPGCDLAELTLEANVDLQELFLDRVKGTVAGALANEGLETGSIAVELFDGSGSVIANCVIKTGDVAAVASALTARKGEIASDVCSALAAAPGLASVACLGEGACSAGGAIVAKLADGSAGTSAPTLAPTPPSTVATTSTSTSATEASTSTSATEASTSTSVTEASTGTSSTVVSTSLPEPALEISTTVTLSTPEPALEMSTTATLATTTITETTAGSLRTTFTLPAGSIPDDPEAAAAVLKRLAEVLAEETGAHASASLGQQHERRLSAAASGQEVEVTFDPGSPELAALLDERRDELTSKLSETAAAAAREAEDSRAPGAATSASSADCGDGGDHFDAIVYAVLGVGAVGALLLCGYAAVACCHEAKKRGRESPREARERLVPPGEQAPGAGADEGAAVQRAQKLPSVGPGGAEAETNLVEGAAAGATALTVRSTNGFGRGDRVQITSHRGSETKVVCGFDGDTGAMLVHTGLFYAHAMGAFVSKVRGPRPADTTPTGVDDGPPEEPDDAPLMIPPTPRSSSSRSGSHWSGPGDAAEAAGWAVTLEAGSAGRPLGLSLVPVEDDEGGALLVGCVHDESRASDWNGELQAADQRKQIRRGDKIEAVNGIVGTPDDRLAELQRGGTLLVGLSRADHRLVVFNADRAELCDQCERPIAVGSRTRWCDPCDWWLCGDCCPAGSAEGSRVRQFRSPAGRPKLLAVHVFGATGLGSPERTDKWCEVAVAGMSCPSGPRTDDCLACGDPTWGKTLAFTEGDRADDVEFVVYERLQGERRLVGRARLLGVNLAPHGDAGEQELPLHDCPGGASGALLKVQVTMTYRW